MRRLLKNMALLIAQWLCGVLQVHGLIEAIYGQHAVVEELKPMQQYAYVALRVLIKKQDYPRESWTEMVFRDGFSIWVKDQLGHMLGDFCVLRLDTCVFASRA